VYEESAAKYVAAGLGCIVAREENWHKQPRNFGKPLAQRFLKRGKLSPDSTHSRTMLSHAIAVRLRFGQKDTELLRDVFT
jgi:hypothetical protein